MQKASERSPSEVPIDVGFARQVGVGVAGMFVTWGSHDFLQEAVFRQPGFKFGLAMAFFLQVAAVLGAMLVSALGGGGGPKRQAKPDPESPTPADAPSRNSVWVHYIALAGAIAAANGLSSSALNHVNMPAKVLFKSSKLIPVMIIGALLRNEAHGVGDYALAVVLSAGLAVFSSADLRTSAQFDLVGVVMLAGAITADAMAPNIQQRVLQRLKQDKEDVIFHTNWMSAVITLLAMICTGEIVDSSVYLANSPVAFSLLTVQSIAGFAGINMFLWCISTFGSRVTVIIASTRKMLTICISYLAFRKPFAYLHVVGVVLVLGAVTVSGLQPKKKPSRGPGTG